VIWDLWQRIKEQTNKNQRLAKVNPAVAGPKNQKEAENSKTNMGGVYKSKITRK